MSDTVQIAIKLPVELVEQYARAADERMIGRNLLMSKVLEEGLPRLRPVQSFLNVPEEREWREEEVGR